MAEGTTHDHGDIVDAYFAKFGKRGDFDRWTLGGQASLALMQEALQRGSPVTHDDLDKRHKAMFGTPYPGDPPPPGVET
jgi:hypothetical protein